MQDAKVQDAKVQDVRAQDVRAQDGRSGNEKTPARVHAAGVFSDRLWRALG